MQTMMFASIKKAIANYSRTSDLKLHNGHGTALDEDLFSAKHVYTVGSDKQLHAFCPATNKIDASHTFKHKLIDCAVYNMPGGEDKIDTLVVADDHKHLFLVQYHQDSRKFVIDFEHSFDDSIHSLCIHPIGTILFGLKKDKSWFVFDLSEVI